MDAFAHISPGVCATAMDLRAAAGFSGLLPRSPPGFLILVPQSAPSTYTAGPTSVGKTFVLPVQRCGGFASSRVQLNRFARPSTE